MIARSSTTQGHEKPRFWFDLLVAAGLGAMLYAVGAVAHQWRQPLHKTVNIDLSLASLPKYALFSLARGWIAYLFSLLFTVVVASWAYYDDRARRFVIVALDILQSLPVLTFLAVFEIALINVFPHSNAGLELACVFVIFTGQVWNMTFSYYDSLRGTPGDFRMLGKLYNFNWWHRFWRIELPFGAQGLLYNSMVSMAGGWFFLMVTEAFQLNGTDFRVPGIGSYMSVAMDRGDVKAEMYGVVAMSVLVLVVDRLIWWPLIVWARKFNLDDFAGVNSGGSSVSALGLWLARSRAVDALGRLWKRLKTRLLPPLQPVSERTSLRDPAAPPVKRSALGLWTYRILLVGLVGGVAWGAFHMTLLLGLVGIRDWLEIFRDAGWSFLRVMAAVALGTLWTVPFGIWIGLNPKLAGRLQPVTQFCASFPSPMIYPWLFGLVLLVGGNLQWGSVLLILFGTQWYILFNVVGAAAAIPNDIQSCAAILHLSGWTRWTKYLIPAVLPSLVTGWITAAGGAWNATIISEYLQIRNKTIEATGLGDYITRVSANDSDFPKLVAAALVMAVIVVVVNRLLWKRVQALANERCRFIT